MMAIFDIGLQVQVKLLMLIVAHFLLGIARSPNWLTNEFQDDLGLNADYLLHLGMDGPHVNKQLHWHLHWLLNWQMMGRHSWT